MVEELKHQILTLSAYCEVSSIAKTLKIPAYLVQAVLDGKDVSIDKKVEIHGQPVIQVKVDSDNSCYTATDNLTKDALTSIYDRKAMDEIMQGLDEGNMHYSLIMCDLDFFKKVNDTHGHAVGDKVLKQFAKHLKASVRDKDIVARYGGEEFVIILPDVDGQQAFDVADRLRKGWQDMKIYYSTTSGGVAEKGQDGQNAKELLKAADKALYTAKNSGRNQIHMPGMDCAPVVDEAFLPSRHQTETSKAPIKIVIAVKPRVMNWIAEIGLHPKIKVLTTSDMRTAISKASAIAADAIIFSYAMDMFAVDAARLVRDVMPNCKIFVVPDFNSAEVKQKCQDANIILLDRQAKSSQIADIIVANCSAQSGKDCITTSGRVRVILVHGLYQSSGSTVLALNITAALKQKTEYRFSRVAFLDLAGHFDSIDTSRQDIGPNTTPGELESIVVGTLACGANIFPAPKVKGSNAGWLLEKYIGALASYHSAIIIDSGSFTYATTAMHQATHTIITIPYTTEATAALKGMLPLLEPLQLQKIQIAVSQAHYEDLTAIKDLEENIGIPTHLIPEDSASTISYKDKQLIETAPGSAFGTSIKKLVSSLIEGEEQRENQDEEAK